MKKLLLSSCLVLMLLLSGTVFGESITFTFANGQITGSGPFYYEFDVMVQAGSAGTKIGDSQAYINYNTTAFGSGIVGAGKVTVTPGALMTGTYYVAPSTADNTAARLAITFDYFYELGGASNGNDLPATPTQWAHVKIEIANTASSSGLTFESALMTDQEYESDDATKYSPVTATDTDDTSLPVTMSTFTATASEQEGVTISWRTESEVNTAGFNVLRSQGGNGTWSKLNGTLIPGQGNSSAGMDYSYIDRDVREGIEYWYKVEEVSTDDQITVYGPISVMGVNAVPAEFSLSQNYPNPFNPETSFKYMVAEDADVTIGVYNLLGKEIKRIVSGRQPAGYYAATWTGVDNTGRSVASGIYFIRMQADNFQMVRKISLMR